MTSSGGAAPVVSMTVVWALPMTGQSTDAASIPPSTCFFMLNLLKPSGELLTTPAALEMFRRPAFTSADVQRVHSQCGLRLWPICTAQRSKEPPGTARYGTKQQNDARPGLNARLSQERRRACWRLQPGWWLTLTIGGDHERLEIHCKRTTRPGCAVVGGRSVRRAGAAVCVPPHGRRLGEFRAQYSACNHYQTCLLARVVERSGQYIAFDAQRSDRRIGHHREKAWRAGWPSALCGGARTTRLAILKRAIRQEDAPCWRAQIGRASCRERV